MSFLLRAYRFYRATTTRIPFVRALFLPLECYYAYTCVRVLDGFLLTTKTFAFAHKHYPLELWGYSPDSKHVLLYTVDYQLTPTQWMAVGAVGGVLRGMNSQEYRAVWDAAGEGMGARE